MSKLKLLRNALVTIAGAILLAVGSIALVTVIVALGGALGATIAAGYNVVLGTALSVEKAALVGSIVVVLAAGSN